MTTFFIYFEPAGNWHVFVKNRTIGCQLDWLVELEILLSRALQEIDKKNSRKKELTITNERRVVTKNTNFSAAKLSKTLNFTQEKKVRDLSFFIEQNYFHVRITGLVLNCTVLY